MSLSPATCHLSPISAGVPRARPRGPARPHQFPPHLPHHDIRTVLKALPPTKQLTKDSDETGGGEPSVRQIGQRHSGEGLMAGG